LARQIGEISVFSSYKHTINQTIFSSRVQITNIEKAAGVQNT